MRRISTAVTITDPLVKYQSLVSAGVCSPDQAQHRLARHLHKVYLRIKDYSPQNEYRQRLKQAARLTDAQQPEEGSESILAAPSHAIWRNPLFKHLMPNAETRDSLAVTRVLQNHELAIEIDSPKGLFLSGEVGTGKSMLLDLLADGLPHERKKRWHFNTFMLYTFAQLDKYRSENQYGASRRRNEQHSLLWMAKKLVDESPILFLDEFQLPDRAASKILSHLFIAFFQLGGVLIASSNRVPQDLEKATGVDYTNAPRLGIMRKFFGAGRVGSELYGQGSDFSKLLEVLKARCDFWQMDGVQDWRRREDIVLPSNEAAVPTAEPGGTSTSKDDDGPKSSNRPLKYFLQGHDDESWPDFVREKTFGRDTAENWQSETIIVYGRRVAIPKHHDGTVFWDFEQLVGTFGPADYITMASSFHTFIIDNVPAMSILQKNEARRFITFLDALYEARCKLVIRAQSLPDNLFFPASKKSSSKSAETAQGTAEDDDDATYSETIAEVYQDQMSPFRPNVSYYDTKSTTSQYDPDQDSDFVLENEQQQNNKAKVDFGNTGAFTGEDERFAYKRAASRLWELCSARWHARTGEWWQPLPMEARHWEGGAASQPLSGRVVFEKQDTGESMGESMDVDEVAGLSRYRIEHIKQGGDPEHK